MADLTTALRGDETAPTATIDRFLRTAEPDVAVAAYDAPVGRLWLALTDRGLVLVSYDAEDAVLTRLAASVSPRVLEAPARADDVRRQFDGYFAGRRDAFDVALDTRLVRSAFQRAVLDAAATIPYGATRTYGDMARAAGNDRAVRAAGSALGANPLCVVVPCHRVVRSGGGLGGYAGDLAAKRWLLDREADSRTLRADH